MKQLCAVIVAQLVVRLTAKDPEAGRTPVTATESSNSSRNQRTGEPAASRRRADFRLVPTAGMAWATAGVANVLPAAPVLVGGLLLLAVGAIIGAVNACSRGAKGITSRTGLPRGSLAATAALAILMSAAVAIHAGVGALQRTEGHVPDAADRGRTVVAELAITGPPRPLSSGGSSSGEVSSDPPEAPSSGTPRPGSRWAVPANIVSLTTDGQRITSDASLIVTGGTEWSRLVPGDRVRAVGKLKEGQPGRAEAARLSASAPPRLLGKEAPPLAAPTQLRETFRAAAAFLHGDAAGLLPGMVTGDTSSLDESLEQAMKTVGLTHLTAVSGANCSLVLGCLLAAARSLRMPRPLATMAALSGLLWFVTLVGPDPSVLRAAVMGAIAIGALSGGRRGRSLGFLCLAVTGLLIADPLLGTSVGFLLSVAATTGILLLGAKLQRWLQTWLPGWLAMALAVPLSAQLFCSPVVVALQPGFSPYALIANVVAAPFVAPITVLGTLAVPVTPLLPWAGHGLLWLAGAATAGVAAVARFFAGLPGSTLPWAEGPVGVFSMILCSVVTIGLLWLLTHSRAVLETTLAAHTLVVGWMDSFAQGSFAQGAARLPRPRFAFPLVLRSGSSGTGSGKPRRSGKRKRGSP
ncbi:ComEC/Rec2 family competence protein [Arthrobacter sp. M4]|uniref:ComEC/Rec2 family competence protein n=1 Tax=Arthrobacter sp. M4 TaxID=218160 RepID=UPI001CDBC4DA|nr:ComEC/Rec2 family competence protein [Arthrobacter sp. M4]MCA4131385.1 ComEC/Rec2 family competence protein [Arthrobacter sp. M4]